MAGLPNVTVVILTLDFYMTTVILKASYRSFGMGPTSDQP